MKVNINTRSVYGIIHLHIATLTEEIDKISILLIKIDLDMRDKDNRTLKH